MPHDRTRILIIAVFLILILLPGGFFLAYNYQKPAPVVSPAPSTTPLKTIAPIIATPSASTKVTASPKTTTRASSIPKNSASGTAKPYATTTTATSTNSSSTQSTTTTSTTTTTTTSSIISLSTTSLNVTMNRGETKNNLYSFTSTGATGFTLYGYPTSYGPGINWTVSTGGMSNGTTVNAGISVNSNVSPGTYTGTAILEFDPGNVQKTMNVSVTVIEPPASSMGYTFSADSVNLSIKNGESKNVFTFTSTGSTGYLFYGYPTTFGPGINWGVSSGGSQNGQTTQQSINIVNVSPGTYTGTALFRDTSSGAEKNIPVTVTVTE